MSERYYITGVQLGMLLAFVKGEQEAQAEKLINEIIDKQFLGNKEALDKMLKKK